MSIRIKMLMPVGVALVLTLGGGPVRAQNPGTALSSSGDSTQLQGKTGSIRASAIAQLAPRLKSGLTAQEAADILGAPSELSEVHRLSAIQFIAQAKKLGVLGAEAALMLKATTGSHRSQAINQIAPYLKAGLTAQEAADILGAPSELSEVHRFSAIQFIAQAKKIRPGLSEGELAPVLAGMTGSNRTLALSALRAPASPVAAGPAVSAGVPASTASAPVSTPPKQATTLGPALTAISPASVTGSKTAQTFSLQGSNLQSGVRVTLYAANFQKTLNPSQVRRISANEVQITIVTDTAADNWSVEVVNPDGTRSARVGFRVIAPTTVAVATPPGIPQQCSAPNVAPHLSISKASCHQLWSYHLYRIVVISTLAAQDEAILMTEKRVMQIHDYMNYVSIFGGAIVGVAATKEASMRVFKAIWESSGIALNLAPTGGGGEAEYARDFVNLLRDSLSTSAEWLVTGTAGPPPSAVVTLANRFAALWNVQFKVLAERNALQLSRTYLDAYYKVGGDHARVATGYGLTGSATVEDAIKAIARRQGIGRLDYSVSKTVKWVYAFQVAINRAATLCAQTRDCTANTVRR